MLIMSNNIIFSKKLIVLLLAVSVCLTMFACGGEDESEFISNEETSVEETSVVIENEVLNDEVILNLIENDRRAIKMFMCNSLYDGSKDSAVAVPVSDEEFVEYSSLWAFLESIYTADSGMLEYFTGYPGYGGKALSSIRGRTYALYIPRSSFQSFIYSKTVVYTELEDGRVEIDARTVDGIDVTLYAVRESGRYKLTYSLCTLLVKEDEGNEKFPMSELGSCSSFEGSMLVIELFLSDKKSDFDSGTEDAFHNTVSSAKNRLITECEAYGHTPTVTYQRAYFDHTSEFENKIYALDMMFSSTSFESLGGFADAGFDLENYDNYMIIVCVNKNIGTTTNRYESSAETEPYYAERIIIGNDTTELSISKSIISLFGAEDYSSGKFSKYTSDLYKQYFSDEMFFAENGTISPVNAFASGMTDELDDMLEIFRYTTNG